MLSVVNKEQVKDLLFYPIKIKLESGNVKGPSNAELGTYLKLNLLKEDEASGNKDK